jgi:hypothetical protein
LQRRSVGLSEAAGSFECLNVLLHEQKAEILKTWEPAWNRFNMAECCQVLNSHGYPALVRSETSIAAAVQNFLKFGNAIKDDWEIFFQASKKTIDHPVTKVHQECNLLRL